jgi:hypothetical protein
MCEGSQLAVVLTFGQINVSLNRARGRRVTSCVATFGRIPMFKMTLSALALATSVYVGVGHAHSAVLTFDTIADCQTSAVSITGGVGQEPCQVFTGPAGSTALRRSTIPNTTDSYWTAMFSSDVSNVSIDLGDLGSDEDRLFLRAFDASDTLLGAVQLDITSIDDTMHTLSLMLTGIRSITFGTIGAPVGLGLGGIYADNLTYTNSPSAVPVPGALPLLATALGALSFAGWRRSSKAA